MKKIVWGALLYLLLFALCNVLAIGCTKHWKFSKKYDKPKTSHGYKNQN